MGYKSPHEAPPLPGPRCWAFTASPHCISGRVIRTPDQATSLGAVRLNEIHTEIRGKPVEMAPKDLNKLFLTENAR